LSWGLGDDATSTLGETKENPALIASAINIASLPYSRNWRRTQS
jgi:hypothetical protein